MQDFERPSLTREQADELLRVVDNLRDRALITLGIATGIRRDDIVNIEIANIDLTHARLSFWEEKKDRDWAVPLESNLIVLLKTYINTLEKGTKYLFPKKGDGRQHIDGKTAYNALHKYLVKAHIIKDEEGANFPFHGLRHTFVNLSHAAGRDIKFICQVTGDTEQTIQRVYRHLTFGQLQEQADSKPLIRGGGF